MDELEANQILEEAQKYIGYEWQELPDDKPWSTPIRFRLVKVIRIIIGEGNRKIYSVNGIILDIATNKQHVTHRIEGLIKFFKNQSL